MNDVQYYKPPRLVALLIGAFIFALYYLWWRDVLQEAMTYGDQPVPLPLAILFSMILGYGLAMVAWLIQQTKGQLFETFRPTRGRIIGAMAMAFFIPISVLSYVPWIAGGLLIFAVFQAPIYITCLFLLASAILYPVTSMIVRHTYERRLLRFGLFCLVFWAAYSGLMLYNGAVEFRI